MRSSGDAMDTLERHYRDIQDVEFTIDRERLYILQTRSAKRTAAAALRAAVEMEREGLISREEAVLRIAPSSLDQLLHPTVDPTADVLVAATGIPASPGAAVGAVVFDPDVAAERGGERAGDPRPLRHDAGRHPRPRRGQRHPDRPRRHGVACRRRRARHGQAVRRRAAPRSRSTSGPIAARSAVSRSARATRSRSTARTGRVIIGAATLVQPELERRPRDDSRLGGLATGSSECAPTPTLPADAARARGFGAEGIGLCRTEHMFFGEERLPVVQEMILADDEPSRREALDRLLPFQQSDFEAIFEAMRRTARHDPAARPAAARVPSERSGGDGERMRERIRALREVNPMLGTRGCRLGLQWPEIYEMQVRAIARARVAVADANGRGADRRDHASAGRLRRGAASAARAHRPRRRPRRPPASRIACGTMIELPRAALRAGEIARYADFFSFGTNDLTQTALGLSRDDAEGKFLTGYLEQGVIEHNPFETLDQDGVGELVEIGVTRGRAAKPGLKIGHLRRARRRPRIDRLLPSHGPRLRLLLAVPGPACQAGGGTGGARRAGSDLRGRRRLIA